MPPPSRSWLAVLLLSMAVSGAFAARLSSNTLQIQNDIGNLDRNKDKHAFESPTGLFIQERASKQLPGPGQHFSFGALVSWDKVHQVLQDTPDSKLVFLIRHGQAISNYLADYLGPDIWFEQESKCSYEEDDGTHWDIFDAELTDKGKAESVALNSMLKDGGWYQNLTAGKPARTIISPLSRCLQTATLSLKDLPITAFNVEENVRETLGEDTCDARRSLSDPGDKDPHHLEGPCHYKQGLRAKFPDYHFPIVDSVYGRNNSVGFGLLADEDPLWTEDRESQKHQLKRAYRFLYDLFTFAPEQIIFVVSHSGTARSLLLAVDREPYRPQNTELVPVIIHKRRPRP